MQPVKKLWQLFSLFLAGILVAGLLAACGDSSPAPVTGGATTAAGGAATTGAAGGTTTTAAAPAPTATPLPTVPQPAGSTKITFWYGLTGTNGGVVQQVVNRFNSSQNKYYV